MKYILLNEATDKFADIETKNYVVSWDEKEQVWELFRKSGKKQVFLNRSKMSTPLIVMMKKLEKQMEKTLVNEGAVAFNKLEKVLKKQGYGTHQLEGYDRLKMLVDAGFGVKYDPDKGVGEAHYKGIAFKIEMGSENFNVSFPTLRVKGGEDELIAAIKQLLSVVYNY